MMNQAQALHHLQTVDLAIEENQTHLADLEKQLGKNDRVIAAEQELQQAEDVLAPWRTAAADLELAIKSLGEKSAAAENRLYSGMVSNPKELQDLQEEIASLKRRRAKQEDNLLEAMIALESGQETYQKAAQKLSAAKEAWQHEQADGIAEINRIKQALVDLQEQRSRAAAKVTAESMTVYDSRRAGKRGHVVAELRDGMCATCGVGQTTTVIQQVRQGRDLVPCANCGRILVLL